MHRLFRNIDFLIWWFMIFFWGKKFNNLFMLFWKYDALLVSEFFKFCSAFFSAFTFPSLISSKSSHAYDDSVFSPFSWERVFVPSSITDLKQYLRTISKRIQKHLAISGPSNGFLQERVTIFGDGIRFLQDQAVRRSWWTLNTLTSLISSLFCFIGLIESS